MGSQRQGCPALNNASPLQVAGHAFLHWPSPQARHVCRYHLLHLGSAVSQVAQVSLIFCRAGRHALLLDKAVKMPHLPLSAGWCFSKAKSSRTQVFWGWCLSIGALGLEFAGILDSTFSSFLSEPASEGLINALWGHTPDGRGK